MAIRSVDEKMLWGASAGRCSNPDCNASLIELIAAPGAPYNVGEMAHIIGRRPGAARTSQGVGPDAFDNLILLCPTCHSHVDSCEGKYPEVLLREWKASHLMRVAELDIKTFDTWVELRREVSVILAENRALFEAYGPLSLPAEIDPFSNSADFWEIMALSVVSVGNQRIVRLMDVNSQLLPAEMIVSFGKFKAHARAFSQHLLTPLENYARFPPEFSEYFE